MFFMYSDLQCRPTANRLTANVGHCHRMADMDCRETALKGKRDNWDKVLLSSFKLPFIMDRSGPNMQVL